MLNLDNSITLDGFAQGKFETRSTGKTDVTQFQIATNSYRKKADGEYEQFTEWHTCEAWGATSKYVAKNLQKGSAVKLEGKLEYSTYTKTYKKGATKFDIKHTRAIIRINVMRISNKTTED